MDTENSNSTPQTERDKLNEQLDELREGQQEANSDFDDAADDKPRSWWTYLWWGLCAVGGLFFFWRALSAPHVTCYVMQTIPDRDKIPVQEPDDSPEIMCYDVVIENIDESEPKPESEQAPKQEQYPN